MTDPKWNRPEPAPLDPIRERALELAVQWTERDEAGLWEDVAQGAKAFEKYLRGDQR